ncbi:hypothetical protein ACFLV2_01445 [Chloroflexota bacterium]
MKGFELDARFNAQHEGIEDLALAVVPGGGIPTIQQIQQTGLGEEMADKIVQALTKGPVTSDQAIISEAPATPTLEFVGRDYPEAMAGMEEYFLNQCWSDGFPLVPPTPEAIDRMLEFAGLPRDHVVGIVEPEASPATVEKIAINAVMAGCLPAYMPVLIAAVRAITDSNFDLRGVQCTAGLVSPLLVVSGSRLIEQLNINDSFSAIGPGWRANSTIGRAIRLIMINIGNSWPGKNDMKSIGAPFKYVMLFGENEAGYDGTWEPIRVAEGFNKEQATVSVMPAFSWGLERVRPEEATVDKITELLTRQAKAKYDSNAHSWGMDNLILLNPVTFETIRREGLSRKDVQTRLFEAARIPSYEFFEHHEPKPDYSLKSIPKELLDKCIKDPQTLVPLLEKPERAKIVVTGGTGPRLMAYVGTWGMGNSYFVTKPVDLPPNWDDLLKKYKIWETPIVR